MSEDNLDSDLENSTKLYNKNMFSKGKSGVHKHYFKGKNRKRKRNLNLNIGEDVIFQSKSSVVGKTNLYVGKVHRKEEANVYTVKSLVEGGRECQVTFEDKPILLNKLKLDKDKLKRGKTVLVSWKVLSGFLQVVPAQVLEVVDDYVWVKPETQGVAKAHIDNLIDITHESQQLNQNLDELNVSQEEVNIVRLMLTATQNELNQVTSTYLSTLKGLQSKISDNDKLNSEKIKLQDLYNKALKTTKEYREQLLDSANLTQEVHTLRELISTQKEDLEEQHQHIIDLDATIRDLREEFQQQNDEIERLRRENYVLQDNIQSLKSSHNYHMQPGSGKELKGRKVGNQKRLTNFFPLSIPNADNPSSKASRLTLKRRAEQLNQVLKLISARENPSSADIIQTLAAYLRRNPDIAIPACKSAKINFATELNAKAAVDLKVLLRLPMTRMRDLRRFLSNINVKFLPSDRHLYKEMSARQYLSKDMVEVGVVNLRKTVKAGESPVAFFRIKNLKDYIVQHIERQTEMGNTWTHADFNNELWIKIGGDKGGTSTKLAFQFVNQKNPNSASSTNIMSMFEATDTYTNMDTVFSNFSYQVAEFQREKNITINGVVYPLRVFYFGDTEYLCKSMGHMGSSSSYPCLWCHIQLKQLRLKNGEPHSPMKLNKENKWEPCELWTRNRTYQSYQQDIANLLAEEEDGNGATRVSGRDHHSISKRPILPFPSDILQIVPPSLHILLGLVVRYFKLLEEECRKLDQGDIQHQDSDLYRKWQSQSEAAKLAEVALEETKEMLEEENNILKGLKKASKGRETAGLTTDSCCMPLCKLKVCNPSEVNVNDIAWIQCVECGDGDSKGWYHTYCLGLTKEQSESSENDTFVCPICTEEISGPQDVISMQEERVVSLKALVNGKKSDYDGKTKVLNETYDEVAKNRGEIETALNDKLENDLKVKRQAYHSQCFVGNHCVKILENTDTLLSILPECEIKNNLKGLFKRLRQIFRFFKADFLKDEEIRALCVRCWELGTWFPRKFPTETIPPKLHFLVCHIPEFVQKWKTVGLLSEHGLESIHKDINSIERIYCTVRESQEKMRLVIGNHQQRAKTNVECIQVPVKLKKTCYQTGCKGRYKLTAPGSSTRKCAICGHTVTIER